MIARTDSALDITLIHTARSIEQWRAILVEQWGSLDPHGPATLSDGDHPLPNPIECSCGASTLTIGNPEQVDGRLPESAVCVPMLYVGQQVGEFRYVDDDDANREEIAQLIREATTALVNLRLNERALRTADEYCASLQAFEEGVILFQEQDREAIGARLLSLIGSMLGSPISALFILDEISTQTTEEAPLHLQHVSGIPETMLDELVTDDGTWWPQLTMEQPIGIQARDADGAFEQLSADRIPAAMQNIVHCPLRYHGVNVGVALAFNVDVDTVHTDLKLDRARRLGELGAAIFHRLSLERAALHQQELETELAIAATIQQRLIPERPPATPELDCAWKSEAAQFIGGDYIDLLRDEHGDTHAIVADVSGHGINSALLMASNRAGYRAHCSRLEPAELMNVLNNAVSSEVGDTGMFITAATMRFEPGARRCTFASAGHNDVLWYHRATHTIETIESTGASLGMFAGMPYDQVEIEPAPGDLFFLYTDGIVEATDANGEMFGDERLIATMLAAVDLPPEETLGRILGAVDAFLGDERPDDDVSAIVIAVRDDSNA